MAQVEEVPGAISQGRTRQEARENVTDALRLMLKIEPGEIADPDLEPLALLLVS
jgi:predicted RNase H-like HicB family nuclease